MKALVTGASGFLGPRLVAALAGRGFDVIALVRRSSDVRALQTLGCRLAFGDVTDSGSLRTAFLERPEAVFHLAAKVYAVADHAERLELGLVNVEGTRHVVEACREAGVGRLVHVSSVVAVGAGRTPSEVLNEDSRNELRTFGFPNFESKRRGEELVLEACRRGEIEAVVVNPGMVFGAGDAVKAPRKGNILAARGRLAFYPRGGLSAVAAADVVSGMVAALERGRRGERYILSGDNLTMRELLSMYARCAGARAPRHEIPTSALRAIGWLSDTLGLRASLSRESAVAATMYHWFDAAKARRELGFRARPAEDAVRESVRWMQENGYV